MIETRYKARLPNYLSYPVGAQAISEVLEASDIGSRLELAFSDLTKAKHPSPATRYTVVKAGYRNLRVGRSGTDDNPFYGEHWTLDVYGVPLTQRHTIRKLLTEQGLPRVRKWFLSERPPSWHDGRHEFIAIYDEDSQVLKYEEIQQD